MAKQLFTNNAKTTLSGSLTQGGTTLVLATGTGDKFPAPTGGNFFYATIYEKDVSSNDTRVEVVKVTARTADTLTIVRDIETMTGQSGGFAYPSAVGQTVYVELRLTAGGVNNLLQAGDVGVSVQGYDADLDAVAALSTTGIPKRTGTNTWAMATANTDYLTPALANTSVMGFKVAAFNGEVANAAASGAVTIDWTTGAFQKQAEPTGTITYTFTAPGALSRLTLHIASDGTSPAVTLNFPATVKWLGTAWGGTTTANKNHWFTFIWDGTNYWGQFAVEA